MPSENPAFNDKEISFMPAARYVNKNLAPEKIRRDIVTEGGKAARRAVDAGVLTPELANLILPNILTENRENFGVNNGEFYANNPAVKKIIKSLGLEKAVMTKESADKINKEGRRMNQQQADMLMIAPLDDYAEGLRGTAYNAKLMTAVLGIKAAASTSPEDAIKRWNGAGPGAENHKNKVLETSQMLNHPANAEILNLFRSAYNNPEGK